MRQIRAGMDGVWRRVKRAIRQRMAPKRAALALSLLGSLLSACGGRSATLATTGQPPSATPSTSASAAAATRPPARPGARGAGINVEPSYRPWRYVGGPAPESWWCVAPNCSPDAPPRTRIDVDLNLARELGVNHVRVEFPWRFIEPQRGVYDWSRADLIVSEADAYHVPLAPVVVYSPPWVGAPTAAPSPDDFRAFMEALVGRYHSSIHYWELWNEPDLDKYWSAGERAYVESILVPGYQGVKSADPSAQVVLGGPSWASGDWYSRIYQYGGGDNFDIASWHVYGSASMTLASASTVQQMLAAHGQANKPLWLGEFGATGSAQASLLTAVLTSDSPIAQADWYNLRDEAAMSCCPPTVAVQGNWGLVRRDGVSLKPAFTTLRNLISAGLPIVNRAQG